MRGRKRPAVQETEDEITPPQNTNEESQAAMKTVGVETCRQYAAAMVDLWRLQQEVK
jgi:hypothetical protein